MSGNQSKAELPAHVLENRLYWDSIAEDWAASGEWRWATNSPG